MKFKPTSFEMLLGAAESEKLPDTPSELTNQSLQVSASSWNVEHLKALRAVRIDNVDFDRLFPGSFLPKKGNKSQCFHFPSPAEFHLKRSNLSCLLEYRKLKGLLCSQTEHDLRTYISRGQYTTGDNNPFAMSGFFSSITHAMSKGIDIAAAGAHQLEEGNSDSDESGTSRSSEEDKSEDTSRSALRSFVSVVIRNVGRASPSYGFDAYVYSSLHLVRFQE